MKIQHPNNSRCSIGEQKGSPYQLRRMRRWDTSRMGGAREEGWRKKEEEKYQKEKEEKEEVSMDPMKVWLHQQCWMLEDNKTKDSGNQSEKVVKLNYHSQKKFQSSGIQIVSINVRIKNFYLSQRKVQALHISHWSRRIDGSGWKLPEEKWDKLCKYQHKKAIETVSFIKGRPDSSDQPS